MTVELAMSNTEVGQMIARMCPAQRCAGHSTIQSGVMEFAILLVLSDGPQPVVGLVLTLEVPQATIADHLLVLEKHGLIERRRDKHDRRVNLCAITPKGVRLLRTSRAHKEQKHVEHD
jgi:DNA-binding MarR family transcriptional regulator